MSKSLRVEDLNNFIYQFTQMSSGEGIQDSIKDFLCEYSSHNRGLKHKLLEAIESQYTNLPFDEFLDVNDYSRIEDLPFYHASLGIVYAYHVLWSLNDDTICTTQQLNDTDNKERTTFDCIRNREELDAVCEWLIQQEWIAEISTENFYFLFSKQKYKMPPVKLRWLRQHGGGPNLRLLIKTLKLITKGIITDKDAFIGKVKALVVDIEGEPLSGLELSYDRQKAHVKKESSIKPFSDFIETLIQGK